MNKVTKQFIKKGEVIAWAATNKKVGCIWQQYVCANDEEHGSLAIFDSKNAAEIWSDDGRGVLKKGTEIIKIKISKVD